MIGAGHSESMKKIFGCHGKLASYIEPPMMNRFSGRRLAGSTNSASRVLVTVRGVGAQVGEVGAKAILGRRGMMNGWIGAAIERRDGTRSQPGFQLIESERPQHS